MQKPTISDSPAEIHIQLLGGFSVSIGERQINAGQFRLRKSRSLIKLLALAPTHRMQRDQLLELLWPEQDPQTASNNFYQALYEARRVLDPSGAHTSAQLYLQLHEAVLCLCPDAPVLIDVEIFRTSANRALGTQDLAAYQAALALYPGDLLPDDRYEDWSGEARETLRQDHLRLLLGLAKAHENQHEYSKAVETLKQALLVEPANEDTHASLMRFYAENGQRALALRQYRLLEETLQRELEAQPDPLITRLYQEILSGKYSPADTPPDRSGGLQKPGITSPPTHNLPVQMTSFVGREKEKQAIQHLLLPQLQRKGQAQEKEVVQTLPTRLVTLTGAGGSGKTRLALETAHELLENYPDGVWLIELAGLSDPDLVPQTLISTLRIQNVSNQALPSILSDFLKPRQILLLMDNCEHLVEACARLVETLLKNCPNLQILATSQEILGLPGEIAYSLSPLSLPDPLQLLPTTLSGQSEAVRLFVARAKYTQPGFILDESNASAVAQICRRLDGIPLAIELAAARVRMMQVQEIAARLEQSFDLLTGGSRIALPRYQSLYASIDWSYHLLSEAERILFRHLAVFADGWTVDAARVISREDATPWDPEKSSQNPEDALELLTQLVNKSLITPHPIPGAPTRYFYLDTIRRFALDRLREAGEEPCMRDRHLDYYEQLAIRLEPLLRGPDQVTTMNRLEAENDNLRTALEWSSAAGPLQAHVEKGLRLAAALARFWHYLSSRTEAVFWLKRLLAVEVKERGSPPLDLPRALARARALYVLAWFGLGDIDQNQKYLEESLVISRELGQTGRQNTAYALYELAVLANVRGDYHQAQALVGESMALFREIGDSFGLAGLLNGPVTYLVWNQGNFDQSKKYAEEALAIYQKHADQDGIAWAYLRLGEIAAREGNYIQAWNLMDIAQDLYCRIDSKYGKPMVLLLMGKTARAQGDPQHAQAIFTEVLDLTRQAGDRFQMAIILKNLAQAAFDLGDYSRASQRYHESLETSREIDFRPAISRALRGLAEVSLAAQAAGGNSPALQLYKEALQVRGNPPDRREIYRSLEALAGLAVDLGQPEQAGRLFSATQSLYESVRFSFWPLHRFNRAEMVSSLRDRLGETAFDKVWSQGQALTLDQTIQLALSF